MFPRCEYRVPGLRGQGCGAGVAFPKAAGEKVCSSIKKRVLGKKKKKKNISWEKFLCRSGACGEGWGGMHFSAKDTLGGPSFGLLKHGLSASPGAAEHRRGGRTSLLCGKDGEEVGQGQAWLPREERPPLW